MVLHRGIVLMTFGIGLGLAGAAGLTRYLSGMLYDLTPLDPATYVAVGILFAAVALSRIFPRGSRHADSTRCGCAVTRVAPRRADLRVE